MDKKIEDFEDLRGETLTEVEGVEPDSECIYFTLSNGRKFILMHHDDCCEHVRLAEFDGDPADLIGSPLTLAVEDSNVPEDQEPKGEYRYRASYTWTFYRLGTVKGTVVLRWLGESNGYYSERVSFEEVDA